MNVEWNWIKQRPHFIAERLNSKCDIRIVYQYKYGRTNLQKRANDNLKLVPLKVIPKITGVEKLRWINDRIIGYKIKRIIGKYRPNAIFLTYPSQECAISSNYCGDIYYDCMDNHSAFICDKKEKQKMEKQEKKLIEIATKVFVSSEYLRRTISERYQVELDKFVLVRNAYNGNIIDPEIDETNETDNSLVKLAYIGTISSWFDFDTILQVLNSKTNVELHLYGPIDKVDIPNNSRIIYHGVIEHEKLYDTIKHMDCLIMPFVLNEIIEAVDPVKVYEYVNFNKNIIIRKYPEVERLKDFVYFYNNSAEFIDAIDRIEQSKNIKYSMKQRTDFLKENSWENRVAIISKEMGL